ncbi:MAG: ATP-dependent RNA helicase DbpA [Candidatus Argoarchaeum ethanivorans]|uniref:ATP-dependent RNA helicase DbpA n=1 Tax=Candidatus Argoarchaeum ethanivorans TaxID=2608793 RepID=A0A812A1K8_9EURY|nr:MAG: ATP-dependent RNA helicase DbpA [Candidatus Argoarchaeum ethanivorans]
MTFFGRYGKFLPIQSQTVSVVLDGKNAIIVSATASGKTEAVIAPLIERYLKEEWSGTGCVNGGVDGSEQKQLLIAKQSSGTGCASSRVGNNVEGMAILYISPTKALVNDMHDRLRGQLDELGVSVSVKTGDTPRFDPGNSPDVLITTPESFDSMICRHTNSFKKIRAVILDEIHLIDNTYRGDQLRLLLKRLKLVSTTDFNIYALSATIADPEDVGSRYLGDFEIITVPDKREIDYTLVESAEELFDCVKRENIRKLLIFCNKRATVEEFSRECVDLWGSNHVAVHHGSLSRSIRGEAESFMKESQYGVCVATMTLEIGIDIGDIDAIVLAEVPWSVSSLLQRIGRGSRRVQRNRVFAIYGSADEQMLLEQMFHVAMEGHVESVDYSHDPSVVVQQVFSSLYSSPGGLTDCYLRNLFEGFCSEDELGDILGHLAKSDWIGKWNDKWRATTRLMDLGAKGEIHSNIPSNRVVAVIDVVSRQTIGEVQYPVDETFVLAGKVWTIVRETSKRLYVKPAKVGIATAKFKRHAPEGAFSHLLPCTTSLYRATHSVCGNNS